jgi:hypothetical protein
MDQDDPERRIAELARQMTEARPTRDSTAATGDRLTPGQVHDWPSPSRPSTDAVTTKTRLTRSSRGRGATERGGTAVVPSVFEILADLPVEDAFGFDAFGALVCPLDGDQRAPITPGCRAACHGLRDHRRDRHRTSFASDGNECAKDTLIPLAAMLRARRLIGTSWTG